MPRLFDAVGFGALNCDNIMLVDLASPPLVNQEEYDGTATRVYVATGREATAGGSAANTIYGLARLGLHTAFAGAIGADDEANIILDSFREVGVAEDAIVRYADTPTGTVTCLSGNHGRTIFVDQGANRRYSKADLRQALRTVFRQTQLVHLTSFASKAQLKLQAELVGALPEGTVVSCAPGKLYVDRGLADIEPILARTDHALFNHEEITGLMGEADHGTAAEAYLQTFPNCKSLVVTHGSGLDIDGRLVTSQVFTPGMRPYDTEASAVPVHVIDTTGAGDALTTGYLYGILTGAEYNEAARIGATVARLSLTGVGARSTLPTKAELDAALT